MIELALWQHPTIVADRCLCQVYGNPPDLKAQTETIVFGLTNEQDDDRKEISSSTFPATIYPSVSATDR